MTESPHQVHYGDRGGEGFWGCVWALGVWLGLGIIGSIVAAPLYLSGMSLITAALFGGVLTALLLYETVVVFGIFWRARMRRTRGLPVRKGERVVFTHGPLEGRSATVAFIGQTKFDYSVRIDSETFDAPEELCVRASDIRRAPSTADDGADSLNR